MLSLAVDFNEIEHGLIAGLRRELVGVTDSGVGPGTRVLLQDDEGHACWGRLEELAGELVFVRPNWATWTVARPFSSTVGSGTPVFVDVEETGRTSGGPIVELRSTRVVA